MEKRVQLEKFEAVQEAIKTANLEKQKALNVAN
jgi:hypothetical protein